MALIDCFDPPLPPEFTGVLYCDGCGGLIGEGDIFYELKWENLCLCCGSRWLKSREAVNRQEAGRRNRG